MKCCATEYSLPLLPEERESLFKRYSYCEILLYKDDSRDYLLRGDKCVFLDNQGLCRLHKTVLKPLTCKIYPLILWKVNPEQTLVWINPCRGFGFYWIAQPQDQIKNSSIEYILEEAIPYYQEYWGEKIDSNNPFSSIPLKRVQNEIHFLDNNKKDYIHEKALNLEPISNFFEKSFRSSLNCEIIFSDSDLKEIINSVLTWLSWSPVGLQLSLINAKSIFLIASLLVGNHYLDVEDNLEDKKGQKEFKHFLSSFLATSILPSFWQNVYHLTPSRNIKKFSELVYQVLLGQISQERLLKL